MADAVDQSGLPPGRTAGWVAASVNVVRASGPALLFGLRLWASVCLALYVAFWLELDVNAYWAGASAALVSQPHLGASLRKGWFRMIGTLVGAFAIVVLTACFPQNRGGFLAGLALWGGACALVATLLRNFAAYAAALAGYTAAIIARISLARPAVRMALHSLSPSPVSARSGLASRVPALFSPLPISAQRLDGWQRNSQRWQRILPKDSPPRWRWPGSRPTTSSPLDASSFGGSLPSTR
jgi:uncharacterized membrane protein YccC